MNNTRPSKVLVVEDEKDTREVLYSVFPASDYEVILAAGGREGLKAFFAARPDLVILDVMMPDMSGWTVLDRIREVSETPVIMLTALGGEKDKVRGLRGGADDYVAKPFSTDELVARCEAVLRRSKRADDEEEMYSDALLAIDFRQRAVYVSGQPVQLSPIEYRLLTTLVQNANAVMSSESLEDRAWGLGYGSREGLRVYISNLRKKLQVDTNTPDLIQTVRGFGYKYVARQSNPVAEGVSRLS